MPTGRLAQPLASKALLQAENQKKVQRRKEERVFMVGIRSNYHLSHMETIRRQLEESRNERLIDARTPREPPVEVVEEPEPLRCVGAFAAEARCLETTHGGATLWTGETDGTIFVRNGVNGTAVFRIEASGGAAPAVPEALCAHEGYMWVGLSDGTTRVYDQQVFVLVFEGRAHRDAVTAFAPTFDDRVFSASLDGTVVKWEQQLGRIDVVLRVDQIRSAHRCLCCYGYNLFVGSADGRVRAVDTETGAVLKEYSGHLGAVNACTVLDGYLFSASDDNCVIVWNIGSAEPLRILEEHQHPVTALLGDPVGHVLWAADAAGLLTVWSSLAETEFAFVREVRHEAATRVVGMRGVVAIDAVKIWSLGSNGANCVWHSANNRVETAIREGLRSMKTIIEQDEVELAKWNELIRTLREVARRFNGGASAAFESARFRSLQQDYYWRWARWLLLARRRKILARCATRLQTEAHLATLRAAYRRLEAFLAAGRTARRKRALADNLGAEAARLRVTRYAARLEAFYRVVRAARCRRDDAAALLQSAQSALRRAALYRWSLWQRRRQLARKQRTVAESLAQRARTQHLAAAFHAWRFCPAKTRRERVVHAGLAALAEHADVALAARYLHQWRAAFRLASRSRRLQRLACAVLDATQRRLREAALAKWWRFANARRCAVLHGEVVDLEVVAATLQGEVAAVNHLVQRRQLLDEAQRAVDATHEDSAAKRRFLEELRRENAALERAIVDKRAGAAQKIKQTLHEQVADLISQLKCRVLNFHVDFLLISKTVDRAKKTPAANVFLEAHQAIKRTVVELTGKKLAAQDEDWGVTDEQLARLKAHQVDPLLNAIKIMIVTYDTMTTAERTSLSSDDEIALNAQTILKLADLCVQMRIKRFGKKMAFRPK